MTPKKTLCTCATVNRQFRVAMLREEDTKALNPDCPNENYSEPLKWFSHRQKHNFEIVYLRGSNRVRKEQENECCCIRKLLDGTLWKSDDETQALRFIAPMRNFQILGPFSPSKKQLWGTSQHPTSGRDLGVDSHVFLRELQEQLPDLDSPAKHVRQGIEII